MWKNLLLSSRTFTCLWIPIHFLYIISFYGFILHCCYLLVATDWILILETSYIQQINMFDFLDSFGRSTRRLSYLEVMHYWRQNNSRMHGMIHLLGQLYCRTYVSLCEAQKLVTKMSFWPYWALRKKKKKFSTDLTRKVFIDLISFFHVSNNRIP